MKNILIGGAWPYTNGSLHIGHVAALLPGDILARYFRAKGERVFYVSGSDCHGTPVTVRAKAENKTPKFISDFYHDEFVKVFSALGFSYDLYTKTSDEYHKEFVKGFHKKMYEGKFVYEKEINTAFCPVCEKNLTDRLIVGICPACGSGSRGDQCDVCGEILESESIIDAKCAECGGEPVFKKSTQLFIAISSLENELREYLDAHSHWRKNAVAFTKRYIDEGLRDRAVTRNLDWGIDVPRLGYEDKKIYIWAENVLGYLSASKKLCEEREVSFEDFFGDNARHYYVHGKDNIPFHTIILPSLLIAGGSGYRLPDEIISSEHLTLEGRKISTSQNYAVWAKDLIKKFGSDSIRYYLIANGPEKRDTDFSFADFAERNNADLVGAYGNFINRTLVFISKYLNSRIPCGELELEIKDKIESTYNFSDKEIENGNFKSAIKTIFELIRFANKYYDTETPWKTRISDIEKCSHTLFNCVQIIANLAVLLHPFLPFSSEKVLSWLGLKEERTPQYIPAGQILPDTAVLFERLDKKTVEREKEKLLNG